MDAESLEIKSVHLAYRRAVVVHGISMSVSDRKKVALLGANGAGKSTLLKAISGFVACTSGEIRFGGEKISSLSPSEIVQRGIVHVPEGRRVFASLTALENLRVSGHMYGKKSAARIERVLATFPQLKSKLHASASLLSGGEQQMLAIGRAMMHEPKLLLLDEISLGLSPIAAEIVYTSLQNVFSNTCVLLVEQNPRLALRYCDEIVVLRNGAISSRGEARQYGDADALRKAYLGEDRGSAAAGFLAEQNSNEERAK